MEKTFGSFVILTRFNKSFEKLSYVRKVFWKNNTIWTQPLLGIVVVHNCYWEQ